MTTITLPPQFGPSREWIIDQRVKELIGLYVTNDSFTPQQQREFDTLNDERAGLMGAQRPVRRSRSWPPFLSFFRW